MRYPYYSKQLRARFSCEINFSKFMFEGTQTYKKVFFADCNAYTRCLCDGKEK